MYQFGKDAREHMFLQFVFAIWAKLGLTHVGPNAWAVYSNILGEKINLCLPRIVIAIATRYTQ